MGHPNKDSAAVKRIPIDGKKIPIRSKSILDSNNSKVPVDIVRSWDLRPTPTVPDMPRGQGQFQMGRKG